MKNKYLDMVKMSDEDYFAMPHLSNSDFRLFKESPLHYEHKELFKIESDSLTIGKALHKLVLEPDSFNDDYIIEDFKGYELNKNSKAYKDAKAEFLQSAKGKTILTADESRKVSQMAHNVMAIAGGLLQDGEAESVFTANFDGVDVKCKADYYRPKEGVLIDVKTTKSIADFRTSILNYGYATQAPFYMDIVTARGRNATRFVFILVETTKPYMVSVREMERDSIEEGRAIYQKYLHEYKAFKETGKTNVVKTTGLPYWYMEKVMGA